MRTHITILFLFFVHHQLCAQDTINRLNIDGEKTGWWKIRAGEFNYTEYARDAIYEEGNFENGYKHGMWTTYYPDGSKMYRCHYNEGVLNGKFISWYNNGNVKERGKWINNHLADTVFTFYYTGQVESIRIYNHKGAAIGCEKKYDIDGNNISDACALDERNQSIIRKGKGDLFYDALRRPVQQGYFKNGKFINGRIFKYNEQGEIYEVQVYKEGAYIGNENLNEDVNTSKNISKKVELKSCYGPIGNSKPLTEDGEFKDGKLWNGKKYVYDKNGLIQRIEIYKEGKYYKDAQLE